MVIKKTNIKFIVLYLFICFIQIILLYCTANKYTTMAYISIFQLVLNLLYLIYMYKNNSIYVCIFIIISWVFHCGQILIKGFNVNVDIIFDFEKYVTQDAAFKSFCFYYISQIVLMFGIIISNIIYKKKKKKVLENVKYKQISLILLLIGIGPRLYIDFSQLINGLSQGYSGVYSLIIPQPIQTFAFFFDASMIFYLFTIEDKKKKYIFIFVIIYKSLMMMTGARQEKLVFLLMWVIIYYFFIRKINIFSAIKLIIIGYIGISFIYSIGNLRAANSIDLFDVIKNTFIPNSKIIGELLGEFGSAFDTLAVTIYKTPQIVEYGFGKSYIAGILSIIPKLVSIFPTLSNKVIYIRLYKGTTFFGGSYLGEIYYNFGSYGYFLLIILGYILGKIQANFISDKQKGYDIDKILSVIIGIYLILFIRGYFTDFVQKIVWLYIVIAIICKFSFKKER